MNSVKSIRKSLRVTMVLIEETVCTVPVSKNDYVNLGQQLAAVVTEVNQKSEVEKRNVTEPDVKS